jgi:hypothetical protein
MSSFIFITLHGFRVIVYISVARWLFRCQCSVIVSLASAMASDQLHQLAVTQKW